MKDQSEIRGYAVGLGYTVEICRRGRWTDYLLENDRVKFKVSVHSQGGMKYARVSTISGDVRFPDMKYGCRVENMLIADVYAAMDTIEMNANERR